MKNYFENTVDCIEQYNAVMDVICNGEEETTDEQDEFLQHYSLYLAHALLKDYGHSPELLTRTADVINDICR